MERVALLGDAAIVTRRRCSDSPPRHRPAAGEPPAAESARLERRHARGRAEQLLAALERDRLEHLARRRAGSGSPANTLRYRIEKHRLRAGRPPLRRAPATAGAAASRRPAPPLAPAPAVAGAPRLDVRWEQRRRDAAPRRARAAAGPRPPCLIRRRRSRCSIEKIASFGGRVEELGPTGIVAAFGLEPVEDAPRRAAHAAMAIQKAVERARAAEAPRHRRPRSRIHVDAGSWSGRRAATAGSSSTASADAWAAARRPRRAPSPTGRVVVSEPRRRSSSGASTSMPLRAPARRGRGATASSGSSGPRLGRGGRLARLRRPRSRELELLASRLALGRRGPRPGRRHRRARPASASRGCCYEFRQTPRRRSASPASRPTACRTARRSRTCRSSTILRRAAGISTSDPPSAIGRKGAAALAALGLDPRRGRRRTCSHLLGVQDGRRAARRARAPRRSRRAPSRPSASSASGAAGASRSSSSSRTSTGSTATSEEFLDRPGRGPRRRARCCSLVDLPARATGRRGCDKSYATRSRSSRSRRATAAPSSARVLAGDDAAGRRCAERSSRSGRGQPVLPRGARAWSVGASGAADAAAAGGARTTVQDVLLGADRAACRGREAALCRRPRCIGREVPLRLLAGDLDRARARSSRRSRELHAARVPLRARRGPDESVYIFKHALTHEVAYESLARPAAGALHAAAAQALERLYAGRLEEARRPARATTTPARISRTAPSSASSRVAGEGRAGARPRRGARRARGGARATSSGSPPRRATSGASGSSSARRRP